MHMRVLDPARRAVAVPEGCLEVLRRERPGGRVSVTLRLHRRADLAAALVGRSAAEAPGVARRLLPGGGWAHRLACQGAAEAATGRIPDPATARARALLAQAEVAVGLVAQACVDWPRLLHAAPQLRHLRYARTALDALVAQLWRGGDPLDPGARVAALGEAELPVSALVEAIETTVLPRAPADPAELAAWAARAPASVARLARAAAEVTLTALVTPAAAVPGLPELVRDPGCGRAPQLAGAAGDPTPFARMPAVAGAARFGPVGARLLARAAQAQAVAEGLVRLDPPAIDCRGAAQGDGASLVEGLRGPLVHRLCCDRRGRVTDFASLAPADWLLHPEGPLAATLAALPAERFATDAPLVLAAFDPCGAVELRHQSVEG